MQTVEDSNGGPQHIESPKQIVGAGVDADETKGIGLVEEKLIGDEDEEVGDGENGHNMYKLLKEIQVRKSFETTLRQDVILVQTAHIVYDSPQGFPQSIDGKILTNAYLHALFEIPYF